MNILISLIFSIVVALSPGSTVGPDTHGGKKARDTHAESSTGKGQKKVEKKPKVPVRIFRPSEKIGADVVVDFPVDI